MAAESNKPGSTGRQSSTSTASLQPAAYEREFVITRIIDAPRTLVFKAWTDPNHMR
ncbi:MAG TPA: hypothetical protein VGY55_20835 [Pirellulales bacterium]|jgi:hypothetical protein|nr:hypothetical protein [Pirellulales bacterium]